MMIKKEKVLERITNGEKIRYEIDTHGELLHTIGQHKICVHTIMQMKKQGIIKLSKESGWRTGYYEKNEENKKEE